MSEEKICVLVSNISRGNVRRTVQKLLLGSFCPKIDSPRKQYISFPITDVKMLLLGGKIGKII